jgi:hypothetical protein
MTTSLDGKRSSRRAEALERAQLVAALRATATVRPV